MKHKKTNKSVGERVPRKIPVAAALARMARTAPAVACDRSPEMGMRSTEQPATYEQIHKALLDRLARQHRLQGRGSRTVLPGCARHQVLHRVEFGAGEERSQVGGGGGDRGDDQAVCALHGAHRAGVVGGSRRASYQAPLLRSRIGRRKRRRWRRGNAARCMGCSSTPRSACITGR